MCNSIQTYWPMDVCFQAVVKSSLNTNHLWARSFIHENSVEIASKHLDESSRQRFKNGEIEITKQDELYEILVKLGTEHLTKFHLILANEKIIGRAKSNLVSLQSFVLLSSKERLRVHHESSKTSTSKETDIPKGFSSRLSYWSNFLWMSVRVSALSRVIRWWYLAADRFDDDWEWRHPWQALQRRKAMDIS